MQLTHWGQDKIATIFQMVFSNAFSWMKMYKVRFFFYPHLIIDSLLYLKDLICISTVHLYRQLCLIISSLTCSALGCQMNMWTFRPPARWAHGLHMKWIRCVLFKIQSGHDSVHRRTDGQGDTSIPPFQLRWSGGYNKVYYYYKIKISLKFVPMGPINDIPALVQIMAWRWPGGKPLSEPMTVNLLMHICVTRPQWFNPILTGTCKAKAVTYLDLIEGTYMKNTWRCGVSKNSLDDQPTLVQVMVWCHHLINKKWWT